MDGLRHTQAGGASSLDSWIRHVVFDLCLPNGAYLGKVLVLLADGEQALFPHQFPSFSIAAPAQGASNACWRTPRNLWPGVFP